MSWLSFFFSWLVAAAGCSAQEVSFQSFFTLGAERCFCTILTRLVRVSSPGQCDRISHKKTPRVLFCPWLPLLRGGECSKDEQGKQQQVSKGGIWACPYMVMPGTKKHFLLSTLLDLAEIFVKSGDTQPQKEGST